MEQTYHVYILASGRNGTIYIGVTGNLSQRIWQHRNGEGSKFAAKYDVHRLVHAEAFADVNEAIAREKAMKKWRRDWKLELIERDNPQWLDLYEHLNG
ncbi:GIY-YIG nuclease family protein [Sphingopyxis witflariensis]|uniref:Excinuclease ABC subunit C n=1 Tax=Sphingopyxis witflariensis TaxID=173675 RepID=A0A246JTB9_9SPHN|nr:GIY-YIG nuclease family protein [Sphingopyxis witflariensis]OWQ96222.1 excinuclease ABC subunit C [Sphingopyxis witflariensis]